VDEFHYLNAARLASTTAYSDFDCTFKCLRNPFCQSINLAASKDTNGKLWCELLSSDRYKNSLDYKESKISHHHFLLENRVVYHQNMTPYWLQAHTLYINPNRNSTTEQLTFLAGSLNNAALLKVPIIPADVLEDSSPVTLKIVVSMDEDIGENEDSDPIYGVSDGVSFLGFETVDKLIYDRDVSPCLGIEGTSGNSLTGVTLTSTNRPSTNDTFYPDQFVMTLKITERWGSCYTAHDGGFVKIAHYNKRPLLSKGLTLEVYKGQARERVGIKFIEVTVM